MTGRSAIVLSTALLGLVARGECPSKVLLAGARDAAKGALGADVRAGLESCFANDSASERDRALAAYLLTLGDADTLQPDEPHLAYLAESDSRVASLGDEAKLRVRRLVADNAYENARFPEAEAAYRRLEENASDELRDYATTKLGWTLMNENRPDRARRHWAAAHAAREKRGEGPQLTWLHGWAQAFVEEGGNASDVETFCRLAARSAEAKDAIVRGWIDGVPVAATAEKLRRVGSTVTSCAPLRTAFFAELGERFAATERACVSLAAVPPKSPLSEAGTLVTGCRKRLEAKQDTVSRLSAETRETLASLTAQDAERGELFAIAAVSGAPERACNVALDVLEARAQNRDTRPLVLSPAAAANACELAMTAHPAYASRLAERLDEVALAGAAATVEDPRVFLVGRLLGASPFRTAFLPRLLEKPGRWRGTVYPALLAERLRPSEPDDAQKLYDAFAENVSTNSATPTASVWEALRTDRVTAQLEGKRFDAALETLRRDAPAKTASDRSLRLWLRTLALVPAERLAAHADDVATIAAKALASGEGRERLAGLELLARAGRWNDVVQSLPKLAPKDDLPLYSDALTAGLFDAAVRGAVPAAPRVAPPELAAFLDSARAVASGKAPAPRKSTVKKTVPEAMAKLAAFGKRIEQAASSRGETTTVVSRWVDVLADGQRVVEKTPWPHRALADAARATLHDFCHGRAEALPKLKRPSQLSATEWGSVTSELEKQLVACAKAHSSPPVENGETR